VEEEAEEEIQPLEQVAQAAAVTVRLGMLTAQMVRLTPAEVVEDHATLEAVVATVERVDLELLSSLIRTLFQRQH
jgi:hypothetical protein